jgi:hypothetical protein
MNALISLLRKGIECIGNIMEILAESTVEIWSYGSQILIVGYNPELGFGRFVSLVTVYHQKYAFKILYDIFPLYVIKIISHSQIRV